MALRLLHQLAGRHSRLPGHDGLPAGHRAQGGREARLVRVRHLESRHRRDADHARPWRGARLVRLRRDLDRGDHRDCGVLSVPGAHLHHERSIRAALAVPRPQLHRRDDLHRDRRPHLLRLAGAAAALSAGPHELPGRDRGPSDGAARDRHHGRHAGGRQAGRAGQYAASARPRPRTHRLDVLRHDRLDAGRVPVDSRHDRGDPGRGARPDLHAAERGDALDARARDARGRRRSLQPVAQHRFEHRHFGGEQPLDHEHPGQPRRHRTARHRREPHVRDAGDRAVLEPADRGRTRRARRGRHPAGADHRLYRRLQAVDDRHAGCDPAADRVQAGVRR